MDLPFYIVLLKQELERRKSTNEQYSLRAFSRSLQMDAGALCRILSGKQKLSFKLAKQLTEKLPLEAPVKKAFMDSVIDERKALLMANIIRF